MVVHSYYPLDETRVQRQAEALVAGGVEVDVICLRHGDEPRVDSAAGVTVHRLPLRRNKKGGPPAQFLEYLAFLSLAFFKLTGLHLRQRYHVVQVHNLPDFLVFAALIPWLTGSRVILDLHDLMPEFYCAKFNTTLESWPVRFVRWQEQLSCRFAHYVITVSEHWRQALIRRGVPAYKCGVVMNVADESIFRWSVDARPRSSEVPDFRLIYHGTLPQRYGLDLAIQAIDQVRYDIPNIHLTILGQGESVDTLMQMIRERNLEHHVTLYNEIRPPEKLPELIRTADVGIVPYRNDLFTDSLLPTKLMEYAALGLPAIAARTTAIEAYFKNTMAEFFEPGDVSDLVRCIRFLYHSPERLAELAEGSRKFNERYNWTRIGADYVALVERLHRQ